MRVSSLVTLIASAGKEVGEHIFLAPLSAAFMSSKTARASPKRTLSSAVATGPQVIALIVAPVLA
jgi:hypothetical protein